MSIGVSTSDYLRFTPYKCDYCGQLLDGLIEMINIMGFDHWPACKQCHWKHTAILLMGEQAGKEYIAQREAAEAAKEK